jgi:acetyltransferase-like isoleucine patch superfamily enzyme
MAFRLSQRFAGRTFGRGVTVAEGWPSLRGEGMFDFAGRVRFAGSHTRVDVAKGAHLRVGDNTAIADSVRLACARSMTIGSNVLIGFRTVVMDSDFHDLDEHNDVPGQFVVIEDGVWLAANVTVLAGVTVGAHAVVGAGFIVTRDVPPYSLAAGNPCRVIRQLPRLEDTPRPES